MRLRLFVIFAFLFLSGINGFCQEKVEDNYMFNYSNDRRPMFKGDMSLVKLNKWVERHQRYPREAKKAGIQGKVIVGFTITKEGSLTNVKILKGCHPLLDAEAVRVIKTTSGKWTCGFMSVTGEPVDVTITCPVVFQL